MDMVGRGGIVLESGLDKNMAFVDRHRVNWMRSVTSRSPDVRSAGAGIEIDLYLMRLPGSTAAFSTYRCPCWAAADRQYDLVTFDHRALVGFGVRQFPRFSTLVNSQPSSTVEPRAFIDSHSASRIGRVKTRAGCRPIDQGTWAGLKDMGEFPARYAAPAIRIRRGSSFK